MSPFVTFNDSSVVPLWTNGQDQPVQDSKLIDVVNASQGKTVHQAVSAGEAGAKEAISAATTAFKTWSTTPIGQRRAILLKAADLLEERQNELDAMQTLETSASPGFGAFNAKGAVAAMREIASFMTTACAGDLPVSECGTVDNIVYRQAIGPVLFISPWNCPTFLFPRGAACALAAGCTVVLKASELCPATYRLMCQLFADAGLPNGVLNQIVVAREDASHITEAIIADSRIRKVEFIGSAAVGSFIGELCGRYVKPVLMELGGKCPAIVCHDADLEAAAQTSVFSSVYHHGQICMCTERIIVVKSVAEEFIRLVEKETIKWADQAGSAVSRDLAVKGQSMVADGIAKGAKVLAGDDSFHEENGSCLRPTILTDVSKDSKIYDTEMFGPCANLHVVDDEDAAIELANSSRYGLIGCIWSKDRIRALALSRRLECGTVAINGPTLHGIPAMASGNPTKGSGWGAVGGLHGIREFLTLKMVLLR